MMTIFDVLIIGIVAYVLVLFSGVRHRLTAPGTRAGLTTIVVGLVAVALFYALDLIAMHILPWFLPMSSAMAIMQDLHLNHRWFVALIGVGSIALGLAATSKGVARLIGDLQASEQDLREARDQALRAAETKSHFLANMSHELRTPLNAILGFSETIKDQTFGPVGSSQYRDYAADIHRSGEHLLGIINNILDLSKIESGVVELCEEPLDIETVTDVVMKLLRHRADAADVSLVANLSGHTPPIYADAIRIRQILINIVANAIKFTEPGGSVTLTCSCNPERGHVFQVSDTGIGIANKDIPLALSVFGQVKNPLVHEHGGTGLGLPLSKKLAELHGGTLQLESVVGVGTTVTITFPPNRVVGTSIPKIA